MEFYLFVVASLAASGLVWTSTSASPDSLNEISYQAAGCSAEENVEWSYRGSKGPRNWGVSFPQCNGGRQSPIEVDTSQVVQAENLERMNFLFYEYPIANVTILNDGTTVKVIPDYPLGRQIRVNDYFFGLYEIHFHWGPNRRRGSEHIIDGQQFAMEMHLVHRRNEDELAVVAVFFEQFNGINAELQHIVNELENVLYRNTSVVSRFRINLINLLPELVYDGDTNSFGTPFYFYEGSLTVPDCRENVSWLLLKTPVRIGDAQIREFRKLFSVTEDQARPACRLTSNVRPVQHLHNRQVYSSK